ncbi:acyltransferase [Mycolicibacterium chubuense]|uniref:O-acetyltransferase OatA n=1 Tax=Mycolicibacterium chubuense TaxID=1800 RepID=A0A0J6WQT6_MYCCU|nr:O-acetyltransferase OatA [Mycolicibacterium chubuense]ORA44919.1 acyltransferase [Mycolicibacterium chubuense]SPY45412.1 putative acyltransferase [Mycolicibacterium chubuense]
MWRDPALTGLRAVAALAVVGTHAAFATGLITHGYVGALTARLDIGVALFFVLSGHLLFRPWVRAAVDGAPAPSVRRYSRRRVRRILPAYVITVVAVFEIYTVFTPGPNPGQSLYGLLRYLTFTQIYSENYLGTLLHPGLSQMWSMAVEVSFYLALPALAFALLRGRWRPTRVLVGLAALAAVTPAWLVTAETTDMLPNSAGMWLPGHLAWFAGGMALAVLQTLRVRCPAAIAVPMAGVLYLVVSTSLGGAILGPDPWWVPAVKATLYAVIATLVVAPAALGSRDSYTRVLASRPVVWLGEISYEIFLLHVVAMALTMHLVLRWPLFTGSMPGLIAVTLALTVPAAWLLHRVTAPQNRARSEGSSAASALPRCEAASFSSGLSSAAVRSEPAGRNTGS